MQRFIWVMIMTGTIIFVSAASPASARTKDRLNALEQSVAELQATLAASNSVARIDQLERQVQQLTGQVEELTFELDQANARLEAVSSILANDPNLAVSGALAQPIAPAPGAQGPVALSPVDPIADQISAADPTSLPIPGGEPSPQEPAFINDVTLPGDPNVAFDYASGFLLQGDYDRARAAFEGYLQVFPNSPRAADAQFRLGEIYLATGANADAADAFISHIRNYPNDPQAAEAYLKLGTSFARLEQTSEACKIFKTMKSKFPGAEQPILDRVDIEMARIQCS